MNREALRILSKVIAALGGVSAILSLIAQPVADLVVAYFMAHPKLAPVGLFLAIVFSALLPGAKKPAE